jgi:hypothetical protein
VDVELARAHWDEGYRRFDRARSDPKAFQQLSTQVDLIAAELRRRVGQRFTLEELAAAYDGAVEWARDTLRDALPDDATPPDTVTVADAAFHVYARGASDYQP